MKYRRIYLSVLCLVLSVSVRAQNSFNHDEVVMVQFLKGETGFGTLGAAGPVAELYYMMPWTKSYKSMANNPKNNKAASRVVTVAAVRNQEKYAEILKDSMESRAKKELLISSDCELDAEWLVEEDKLNRQKDLLKKNISDIVYYGGSVEDKESWTMIYNSIDEGINETHNAYMPNAKRKSCYLLFYKDLCNYNMTLSKLKSYWWAQRQLKTNEGCNISFSNARSVITESRSRWKAAWRGAKTYQHGQPHGSGIDASTVQ